MAGRKFDEWQVGERIVHEIPRTVTETDDLCGPRPEARSELSPLRGDQSD